LVERPSGVTHWNGPYLKGDKVPEDPWGRPFVYHNPSQRPGHEYDLYSLGPTGQPGGTGDAAPPSVQETQRPSSELALVKWSAARQKCQFSECYRIAYTLRDNYDKSIKLIDASIDFADLLGAHIFGIKLLEDVRIEPHSDSSYSGNWEINQFRARESRLGEIPPSDVQARLRVRAIVFADNSRFETK
jgi:hypothetical protein